MYKSLKLPEYLSGISNATTNGTKSVLNKTMSLPSVISVARSQPVPLHFLRVVA
jgi:hypothetical protein